MTDTHCHLYLNEFQEDLEQVLDRAVTAGVRQIFMPAITLGSFTAMQKMQHPGIGFFCMAGIHPCEITSGNADDLSRLQDLASTGQCAGIGETGLDYYRSKEFMAEQKTSLIRHCEIAKAVKKPVILHNRNSTSDLLDIVEQQQDGHLTGIWHCFNGSEEEGKRAIDLNLYLGIGGILTFKNAGVDKTVKDLPLHRLLLETDAPYLAPHPKRGKRNEPAFIRFTASRLAEIKGRSLDEVIRQTTQNANQVFKVPLI
ncbi:MAG: TatD family hydrolase [Balneolales bacterium]